MDTISIPQPLNVKPCLLVLTLSFDLMGRLSNVWLAVIYAHRSISVMNVRMDSIVTMLMSVHLVQMSATPVMEVPILTVQVAILVWCWRIINV